MDAIVFSRVCHPGNIGIALATAKAKCSGCRVVYLHDSNSGIGWADSVDMSESHNQAWRVVSRVDESIYGHKFPTFHKVSITRWKLLLDWMESAGVSEVANCDSDVLLFDSPVASPHYQKGKLHVSDSRQGCVHAGHCIVSLCHVREVWGLLCEMIGSQAHRPMHDMLAWNRVAGKYGYVDQSAIIDGVAFDHHMGRVGEADGGWEDDGTGYKKITWVNNVPHCLHVPTGQNVRLINLHCWGAAENRMGEFAKLGGIL